MEKVKIIEPFTEYEEEGTRRVDRKADDEITVTNDRAEQLRERGFIAPKPGASGKARSAEDPGTADEA